MARDTTVKNLEENQKIDPALAQQLAKTLAALHDLEN